MSKGAIVLGVAIVIGIGIVALRVAEPSRSFAPIQSYDVLDDDRTSSSGSV